MPNPIQQILKTGQMSQRKKRNSVMFGKSARKGRKSKRRV